MGPGSAVIHLHNPDFGSLLIGVAVFNVAAVCVELGLVLVVATARAGVGGRADTTGAVGSADPDSAAAGGTSADAASAVDPAAAGGATSAPAPIAAPEADAAVSVSATLTLTLALGAAAALRLCTARPAQMPTGSAITAPKTIAITTMCRIGNASMPAFGAVSFALRRVSLRSE